MILISVKIEADPKWSPHTLAGQNPTGFASLTNELDKQRRGFCVFGPVDFELDHEEKIHMSQGKK